MKNKTYLMMLAHIAMVAIACKEELAQDPNSYSRLKVTMKDSPGDYDSVIISVKSVEVKTNNGSYEYPFNKSVNLLELVNGKDTVLADESIPTGRISQVRLILEETGNYIYKGGERFDLKTPSAQQSGLKLNIQKELVQGITYTLELDFDVAKSIVETGSGEFILKPVIRVMTEAITGGIKGIVLPSNDPIAIMAIINSDTFSTYTEIVEGKFIIKGLSTGQYKLMIDPAAPLQDTVLNNVSVQNGQITDIGTVTLQ